MNDLKHWRALQDDQPYLGHWSILAKGVQEIEVTIEKVYTEVVELQNFKTRRMEKMNKLFVKLAEFKRPWIMNKVNPAMIERVLNSHNPSDWVGEKITIYSTTDTMGKKQVDCIRVKAQKPKPIDLEPFKAQLKECGDKDTLRSVYGGMPKNIQGKLREYSIKLAKSL